MLKSATWNPEKKSCTDAQIYKSDKCNAGTFHIEGGLALSHRCVYPTHLPGTVTPICLPNTPTWHCHTDVSTQHTDLALSHRCVYPTHLPHNKSNKRFYTTTTCFNPPVIIRLTTKGKYEHLYSITSSCIAFRHLFHDRVTLCVTFIKTRFA